ncbi:MAG: DNA-directed RNA polymerase subunit alpha [Candidatus Muiribacteriaceae bacterium]
MKNFNIPDALKFKEISEFHNVFILEPLRSGYGETMGNFMRDLLVNELPGYSPVSIQFDTLDKKSRKLEDTEEQIIDIVMNIKNIICTLNDKDEYVKKISFKGEKVVSAGDIADDELEIFNPEMHLFKVKKGREFSMEITFKKGSGYVLSYEHLKEDKVPFNKFYVDSFFSPIVYVDLDISPIRIGGEMNFEQLTLEIKTNDTLSPKDAIRCISELVTDRLKILSEEREIPKPVFEEEPEDKVSEDQTDNETETEEEVAQEPRKDIPVEEMTVMDLDISQRAKNCLKNFPYKTVMDFTRVSADELMRLKNFGQKTLDELREKLAEHGLTLKGETLE